MSSPICLVSCIFGKQFSGIYPSPFKNHSYFFSNNINIKEIAILLDWNYIYVPFPIEFNKEEYTSPDIQFSLQSKFVKFIQFLKLKEYKDIFSKYSYILYADHKRYIKPSHIKEYLNIYKNKPYPIIISSHEKSERNLGLEIEESLFQMRYTNSMPETYNLVREYNIPLSTSVCNTGIIFYSLFDMDETLYKMIDNIYNTCLYLKQPQCQIIWTILSYPYSDKIKTIPFNQIKVQWKVPNYLDYLDTDTDSNSKDYSSYIYIFLIIVLVSLIVYCGIGYRLDSKDIV